MVEKYKSHRQTKFKKIRWSELILIEVPNVAIKLKAFYSNYLKKIRRGKTGTMHGTPP